MIARQNLFPQTNNEQPAGVLSFVYLIQIVLLAAAYFVTGKLGTYLAIPPGYATAIWPPSGIALAGVLIFGYRVWPAILLGSVLVNFSISLTSAPSTDVITAVVVTIAIGCGAALQAIAGAYLLRRYAGFPNQLTSEKEVGLFIIFAGFLSTLVSSSIGVAVLTASGKLLVSNSVANWLTWWAGDAVGILIFAPLILAWTLQPAELWRSRRVAVTLTVIVAFTLTVIVSSYASHKEGAFLKTRFENDATTLISAFDKSMALHLNVLRSVQRLYLASETVNREDFKLFTTGHLEKYHGIQALSWNPVVLAADRKAYERDMQMEGFQSLSITELDGNKKRAVAREHPEYVPVSFIEPMAGNEKALGYDVYSDPIRKEAINRARDTGDIAATAPIRLVQEDAEQLGVLAFMPIYQKGAPTETVEARRSNIKGYAVAVFLGQNILNAAFENISRADLSYRLMDIDGSPEQLFTKQKHSGQTHQAEQSGLLTVSHALQISKNIDVGGRKWRLDVYATPAYLAAHHTDATWYSMLIGLLLTSMATTASLVLSGRNNLLKALIAERTQALQEQNDLFTKMSRQVPGMLYQFKRHADGRFSFPYVSEGIFKLYGLSPEDVREDASPVFDTFHPDDYHHILATIEQSLKTMKTWMLEYRVILPNQEVKWHEVNAHPEKLEDGSVIWHGFITDITERKNAEAIFHGVFDQSSFLAGILDAAGNLVSVNQTALNLIDHAERDLVGQYFPDTP